MGLLERLKGPTPIRWKIVGYVLLTISTSTAGILANYTDFEYKNLVIGIIIVSGVIGHVITDLTTDTPK